MAGTRKIAAILAADVVGFSRMTGADEERTLARLRALRSDLIDPAIAVHNGRAFKRTGDGFLVEFRSVVEAVRCAIEVQNAMVERNAGLPPERRIDFRVGVHLGDVVEESDGDLMGDGVNIAARLEGIAEPGSICLSGAAYEQVRDRLKEAYVDLGEQALKNIARPVRAYRLQPSAGAGADEGPSPAGRLALPEKPSIAVLPFQNLSGDPQQEYFADGMVEEITTALSRARWLFVIARNSSFAFKTRSVDVKQVGRELGVRYLLEGSVRRAGDRVRVAGRLVDAASGGQLWSEHFDGGLEDVFALQDRVAASVAGAVAPKLEQVEIERARRKPTDSLDAYDYYLRGMAAVHLGTREAVDEASRLFLKAVEHDAAFASAFAMAAFCGLWRKTNGWMADSDEESAEIARLARRAADLGRDDAVALTRAGHSLAYVAGEFEDGVGLIDVALGINPNLAIAWYASGWVRTYLGEADVAIAHLARAMRLSPLDPETNQMQAGTAFGHFLRGRYDEALAWAKKALRERPDYLSALRLAAASSALGEKPDEARRSIERLRALDPGLRLSTLASRIPLRRAEDLTRYADGLRKAGLPE